MAEHAHREITQRELRNESGSIMRGVERGDSFIITRNGTPIGKLIPLRRRTYVPRAEVMAAFATAPPLDAGGSAETSTRQSTRTCPTVSGDSPADRGLIDTNIVIHLAALDPQELPEEMVISAVTLAELSAGPHHTDDPAERARRTSVLQHTEATFDPLPFDAEQRAPSA